MGPTHRSVGWPSTAGSVFSIAFAGYTAFRCFFPISFGSLALWPRWPPQTSSSLADFFSPRARFAAAAAAASQLRSFDRTVFVRQAALRRYFAIYLPETGRLLGLAYLAYPCPLLPRCHVVPVKLVSLGSFSLGSCSSSFSNADAMQFLRFLRAVPPPPSTPVSLLEML